jgi:hypothetical protein
VVGGSCGGVYGWWGGLGSNSIRERERDRKRERERERSATQSPQISQIRKTIFRKMQNIPNCLVNSR